MFHLSRSVGRKISQTQLLCRQHSTLEPMEIRPEEMRPIEQDQQKGVQRSERYLKFKEKLRSNAPIVIIPKKDRQPLPVLAKEQVEAWPNNTNPLTGEIDGPRGLEPTRYGDWQSKGRVSDFWGSRATTLDSLIY